MDERLRAGLQGALEWAQLVERAVVELASWHDAMTHMAEMWAELTPPGLDADHEQRWTCYVPLLPRDRQLHYGDTPQAAIEAAWQAREEAQR